MAASSEGSPDEPDSSLPTTLPTTMDTLLDQDWWQECVASFLPALDAIHFSGCCRRARCVEWRPAADLEHREFVDSKSQHAAVKWQTLPPGHNRSHTVRLKGMWQDQGWGNRKGYLHVVRGEGHAPNDYCPAGPHVIARVGLAPHVAAPFVLDFQPDADAAEPYSLWYNVGGDGGHRLLVRELVMRELVYV